MKVSVPFEPLWKESLFAVKNSIRYEIFENFRCFLYQNLPQNSERTRYKNGNAILYRFFPGRTLDQLSPKIWRAYGDEILLQEIMRFEFLNREKLPSLFVQKELYSLPAGTQIPKKIFEQYLVDQYGEAKPKIVSRLVQILHALEYLTYKDRADFVPPSNPNRTAFLVLLHYLFSQTPQTISLNDIVSDPFWKYLRIMNVQAIRQILREATAGAIISKYVVADQLEQITTKYPFCEFIERKIIL